MTNLLTTIMLTALYAVWAWKRNHRENKQSNNLITKHEQ